MDLNERFIKENLKANLRNLREYNRLNQKDIADALKIERSTYASWETGRSMPKPTQLAQLSELFDCSVDFLITNQNAVIALKVRSPKPEYKSSNDSDRVYGDKFFIELSDEERALLLKYRLLNNRDKESLNDFLDDVRNADETNND